MLADLDLLLTMVFWLPDDFPPERATNAPQEVPPDEHRTPVNAAYLAKSRLAISSRTSARLRGP